MISCLPDLDVFTVFSHNMAHPMPTGRQNNNGCMALNLNTKFNVHTNISFVVADFTAEVLKLGACLI